MPEKVGQKNIYLCNGCGGQIVTVIVDEGTTPMMLACRVQGEPAQAVNSGRERFLAKQEGRAPIAPGCRGVMRSTFYRFVPEAAIPTHEWYRPRDLSALSPPAMRDHVARGGLEIRRIAQF